MRQYLDLIEEILAEGDEKDNRTGTGTFAIHGTMMRFDLREGFPILTTKRVNFKAVVAELLWFIKGSTNIRDLDAKIWDDWAQNKPIHGEGDVGPIYGFQWRHWGAPWMPNVALPKTGIVRAGVQEEMSERVRLQALQTGKVAAHMVKDVGFEVGPTRFIIPPGLDPLEKARLEAELKSDNPNLDLVAQYNPQPEYGGDRLLRDLLTGEQEAQLGGIDQLANAIETIKTNPKDRRIIVSAWNPADIPDMGLPPCHLLFQFHPSLTGFLDLTMYQRSCDMAVGVPFNIASYALLLSLVANECKLKPRWFSHVLGDAHVYKNHVEGLRKQLDRKPHKLPTLKLTEGKPVFDITAEDIKLVGYDHDKFIKFEVAV
jgi:thymidylate synthase